MRILLVEDEPDVARMLAKGLREQSYAVDVAAQRRLGGVPRNAFFRFVQRQCTSVDADRAG
jgi:DNA-binding response OmpR family regulator